ncbi:assimilatory sulfite reductase (NADPH) flavoprotein subunit [Luteimonas aquatica]|uniref:assimilatory sulfite reductase (NADPH) flavoprotein subunit n=1 Tax=Luteimonas aquatica TaxID=450364 RepID=UPI001F57D628|nr:assimilatory sulfite reductase (NADPH) flavoprotein subunit [Luteimonas aquatica]
MPSPNALPAPPLSDEQADAVVQLTRALDAPGLWWLSGYAAGLATSRAAPAQSAPAVAVRPDAATAGRLTIVYGSQTGNAKRTAEQLAQEVEGTGVAVRVLRADAYPVRELKTERHLYLVISTQGDGDPPDDARELVEFLAGKRAPRLEQLRYAVLGLGDSSYPQFCAIGQRLDARLAELGAQRLLPRGDADLDVDTVAAPWRAQALAAAREALAPAAQDAAHGAADASRKPLATVTPLRPQAAAHGRDHPFAAELLANQRITLARGRGASPKDIRHIELSLEDSGLHYEPGDALGLWPRNPEPLVEAILSTLKLDGEREVAQGETALPLREWLTARRELTRLARPFLAAHAERAGDAELQAIVQPGHPLLADWLANRQVIDLLQRHPADWSADALVAALRPLTPRLYSIASSRKAVGEEVHLTVAHVEYGADADTRWGAASHYLATRAEGERLPVYVEANERFRLPADAARDVIMIGPGTGVAPFRAFVQERAATRPTRAGAPGRNWLFFGNPHFRSDFLYQLEWQRALKSGELDRIDLAFSRDASRSPAWDGRALAGDSHKKIYVQDRIRERGAELYDWLENGAHLYVCGAIAMGKDVHGALLDAVSARKGGDREAAVEYLDALQREGRYARDVY